MTFVAAAMVAVTLMSSQLFVTADSVECGNSQTSCSQSTDDVALMQMGSQVLSRQAASRRSDSPEECGRIFTEDCEVEQNVGVKPGCHTNGADYDKPLKQVREEHPGTDLWCYFNDIVFFFKYPGLSPDYVNMSVVNLQGSNSLPFNEYTGDGKGPEMSVTFDGRNMNFHLDAVYMLSDTMLGYALGVLQGQGLDTSLISNHTAWENIAVQHCETVRQKYDVNGDNMTLHYIFDHLASDTVKAYCKAGMEPPESMSAYFKPANFHSLQDCQEVTPTDYAHTWYAMCMVSPTYIASMLASFHLLSCQLDGDRVGHLSECPGWPKAL